MSFNRHTGLYVFWFNGTFNRHVIGPTTDMPLNQTTYSPVCRSNGMGPTTIMSCNQQPWRLNGKSIVGPNAMPLNVPFNWTIYSPVCRSNGMVVEWDVGCR